MGGKFLLARWRSKVIICTSRLVRWHQGPCCLWEKHSLLKKTFLFLVLRLMPCGFCFCCLGYLRFLFSSYRQMIFVHLPWSLKVTWTKFPLMKEKELQESVAPRNTVRMETYEIKWEVEVRCPWKRKIKAETLNKIAFAWVFPETDSDTRIWFK